MTYCGPFEVTYAERPPERAWHLATPKAAPNASLLAPASSNFSVTPTSFLQTTAKQALTQAESPSLPLAPESTTGKQVDGDAGDDEGVLVTPFERDQMITDCDHEIHSIETMFEVLSRRQFFGQETIQVTSKKFKTFENNGSIGDVAE